MRRIYLDYNATAPLSPTAEAVLAKCGGRLPQSSSYINYFPAFNASSMHAEGRIARAWVDEARWRVARCLGVQPHEIVFTSGGTESNNLAIIGAVLARLRNSAVGRLYVMTSAIEHHCVLASCQWLQRWFTVKTDFIPVDQTGIVCAEKIEDVSPPYPLLISVMAANNEIGTRQPVERIGQWTRKYGILFHVDAVQLAGRESLKAICQNADLVSFSGHKIGAPHGTGVLYVRSGVPLEPLIIGGWQELGRRAGTENAASLLALAAALEAAEADMQGESRRLFELVERLWQHIALLPNVRRNGHITQRIANTLNVTFLDLDQQTLLMALDLEGLSVSSGSACVVGTWQPSHVLAALGYSSEGATVRFSLGKETSEADVEEAAERVKKVVNRLRSINLR
ncbi:MAG: cysteine desulfurase [Methylacidiphilales bacterium]|nr:cysteine desulfurase [Candidatus Methylacidiphilales bacterium]MDW8349663.1 cysteine desulfurase family protein [Verrucomicrobiae bacterium]